MTLTIAESNVLRGLEVPAPKTFHIEQQGANIGARVDGVRLGKDTPRATVKELYQQLLRYKVLFISGQHGLTEDDQYAFAQQFGTPTLAHPTVHSFGLRALPIDSQYSKSNVWHTDVTFVDRVPKISILRAITLPIYGGSTVWANTVNAYSTLPDPLKVLAEQLWVFHTNVHNVARDKGHHGEYRVEFEREYYQTLHPLVRVHPETQEKSLVLGKFFEKFDQLNNEESQDLYRIFQNHIIDIENTVRWNWSAGDVAIWDNRATQHYAVADYDDQPRLLSRITLAGDIPRSVDGELSQIIHGDASEYSIIDNHFPFAIGRTI